MIEFVATVILIGVIALIYKAVLCLKNNSDSAED
jgi:hypothetical protein